MNLDFSVIGISETWLNDKNSNTDYINIEGYNFIHKSRDNKSGGGVGLFIRNDTNYKLRNDLSIRDSQTIESIFIEIIRPNKKNAIIGVLYRPPSSNFQVFMNEVNELMAKFTRERKDCYLMGDFNIDLLKYQHIKITQMIFLILCFHILSYQ